MTGAISRAGMVYYVEDTVGGSFPEYRVFTAANSCPPRYTSLTNELSWWALNKNAELAFMISIDK